MKNSISDVQKQIKVGTHGEDYGSWMSGLLYLWRNCAGCSRAVCAVFRGIPHHSFVDRAPVPRTRIREHSGNFRILFHRDHFSFGKHSMGTEFSPSPCCVAIFYSDRFSVQNS